MDAVGRRACSECNLAREVELINGSRILVCDGGTDEMVQVEHNDICENFEQLWPVPERAGDESAAWGGHDRCASG